MSLTYLEIDHIDCVRRILSGYLHDIPVSVFIFGSRAGPAHRPGSDLDLLLDTDATIPLSTLSRLNESFEESDLPFRVDIVLRADMSPDFYNRIQADLTFLCAFGDNSQTSDDQRL